KSLGYLFPAAFIATPKSPIVISTYTTVLQNQLFFESLPMIEKMFNRNIKKTLIKSSEHYLSLSVFERWLKQITAENSEAYLCMDAYFSMANRNNNRRFIRNKCWKSFRLGLLA